MSLQSKYDAFCMSVASNKIITSKDTLPLTLDRCLGKQVINYKLYGNTTQENKPISIDDKCEFINVGQVTENLYPIDIITKFMNLTHYRKNESGPGWNNSLICEKKR